MASRRHSPPQRSPPRPAARSRRRTGLLTDALLLSCLAGALVVAPRIMDGQAALEWTRYYAARGVPATHVNEQARQAARWAVRAVDRSAPMPLAGDAARLALDLGRSLEPRHPDSALTLYSEVRAALDRACAARLRRLGLQGLAAEARALEERARARLAERRKAGP